MLLLAKLHNYGKLDIITINDFNIFFKRVKEMAERIY